MKAIRGATTVLNDTAEDIKKGVSELLLTIKSKNAITENDIVCIMFSNTSDLRS